MTPKRQPKFIELDEGEARSFLARQHLGRIAYTFKDRVDIEPISYTYHDGWILGRTSIGAKLATLAHHPWCAFEVDVVFGQFEWTSVVAKGMFQLLDPESGSPDVYQKAVDSARSLVPDAFSPSDPAPHRDVLFGVFVNEITGRSAKPG